MASAMQPSTPPARYARAVEVRPTFAEIDTGALRQNIAAVQRHVGGARVLAVVKADGYGHGATTVSKLFVEAGAWGLAVSLVEEGVELREAGVHAPVVVLGGVAPDSADVIVHRQLTPVVWSVDQLERLKAAVLRTGAGSARVHVKIDSGMTRLGLLPGDLAPVLDWFARDGGRTIEFEGVMTHLACADDAADVLTSKRQLGVFDDCLGTIAAAGLTPRLRHACNSAGLVRFGGAHFDMVRPGIALYGAASSEDVQLEGLRQSMSVRSSVLAVREVPAGVRVSYGGRDQLDRASRLAIVPVGYADGYPRNMSGAAEMIVRGHRCRVVGNITMDVTMLDVTDLPGVRAGEAVTLLGRQGLERVDLHEMAGWSGTLSYEVTCGVSKRVPRRYV
ncbi:MAG: alanine racemase [Myxococcota bacterium]